MATRAAEPLARAAVRVPSEIKDRWMSAASMRGQSLTDFIIGAANNAVSEVFAEYESIALTRRGQNELAALLEQPPALSPRLRAAIEERLS